MTAAEAASAKNAPSLPISLLRLARPTQWSKSVFVLIGPFYGYKDLLARGESFAEALPILISPVIAAVAFALASSGCYVFNDLADRVADQAHPRKRRRPIAAGHVAPGTARIFGMLLFVVAAALLLAIPSPARTWVAIALALYVINVMAYSAALKHYVIADVMSLSCGFVLRVMGGCAAAAISPSVWLLNVVLFLSMFLAFGKRLGERRTLGVAEGVGSAVEHRRVQAGYTDTLLQMAVVVTAVITLMTYALYVNDQGERYIAGFNLMWLTVLPATYAMLRAIVIIERGLYDDPTELAVHDRPFQAAGLLFAAITVGLMVAFRGAPPAKAPGTEPLDPVSAGQAVPKNVR